MWWPYAERPPWRRAAQRCLHPGAARACAPRAAPSARAPEPDRPAHRRRVDRPAALAHRDLAALAQGSGRLAAALHVLVAAERTRGLRRADRLAGVALLQQLEDRPLGVCPDRIAHARGLPAAGSPDAA